MSHGLINKKATDGVKPPVAGNLQFHTYNTCHHHIQLIFSFLAALFIIMCFFSTNRFWLSRILIDEIQNIVTWRLATQFEC